SSSSDSFNLSDDDSGSETFVGSEPEPEPTTSEEPESPSPEPTTSEEPVSPTFEPTTSEKPESPTFVPTTSEEPTPEPTTTSTSTTKSILSVPTSVDFSRLTAEPTETPSHSDSSDDGNDPVENKPSLPQVITNPLASACTQCLKFNIRILAPYENLFGSTNYLASQAFNEVPNVIAQALGINYNRVTSSAIFAVENAVVSNRRRSLVVRDEPAGPHYYMSMSITKDGSALNPKLDLQQMATRLKVQIADTSSSLHDSSAWGPLIDSGYFKVTNDLDNLDGVAQVDPNSPEQVDSPFKGDSKSNSRSKWIGIGIGIFFGVLIILLVIYWRLRHRRNKNRVRQNFVAID
ncbi:hypothetical protein H4R20_001925, partial [Coemansia guatemalensis]